MADAIPAPNGARRKRGEQLGRRNASSTPWKSIPSTSPVRPHLRDVFERLRENNRNFGGGFIEHAAEQYTVRGLGRTRDIEDINRIVLMLRWNARAGAGCRPGSRRRVPRQGAVLRDGEGETVSGMAIMLKGENGLRVIDRVKKGSRLCAARGR